jgi:hypothetical protein
MPEISNPSLYASPRVVTDLGECIFYHTMDIPGVGHVDGIWDLRGRERAYIGGVDVRGQRVLEIGTANGFLCFYMEKHGAKVVAYDLDEHLDWDIVPTAGALAEGVPEQRRRQIRQMNNGYWLCHRAFASKAKVVYGSAYEVPEAIGPVDTVTFCSVLLHLRDPFRAMQSGLRLAQRTAVVTERIIVKRLPLYLLSSAGLPCSGFEPRARANGPIETWWTLPPRLLKEYLAILGFGAQRTTFHFQTCGGQKRLMFTIVASRP